MLVWERGQTRTAPSRTQTNEIFGGWEGVDPEHPRLRRQLDDEKHKKAAAMKAHKREESRRGTRAAVSANESP